MSTFEYPTKKARHSTAVFQVQSTPRGHGSISANTGRGSMTMTSNIRSRGYLPTAPGEIAQQSKKTVEAVAGNRGKEKQEMNVLNTKLADVLDKTRFMEGQNRQLNMELEKWKKMKEWDGSKIKDIIVEEVESMRKDKDELNKQIADLNAKLLTERERCETILEDNKLFKTQRDKALDDQEKLRRINDKLEQDLHNLRSELEMAEKRTEIAKQELQETRDDVESLRCDLQDARRKQMESAQEMLAERDRYEFELELKDEQIAEMERLIKDMQALEPNYAGMWEGQFKKSIQNLQADCDERLNRQLADMELKYQSKIDRLEAALPRDQTDKVNKVETKTLKSEIGGLNSKLKHLENENADLIRELKSLREMYDRECRECAEDKEEMRCQLEKERYEKGQIKDDLENIMDAKNSLEMEIRTYEALLQSGAGEMMAAKGNYQTRGASMAADLIMGGGEGGRGSSGGYGGGSGGGSSSQQSRTSHETMRQRISKSTKGNLNISIEEMAMDGSYVRILNKSNKEIQLEGMKLVRNIDGDRNRPSFTFPRGACVAPGKSVLIFCYDERSDAKSGDFIGDDYTCRSWGKYNQAGTFELKDASGALAATYKISFE